MSDDPAAIVARAILEQHDVDRVDLVLLALEYERLVHLFDGQEAGDG